MRQLVQSADARADVTRSALVGALGGLAGTAVMSAFMAAWSTGVANAARDPAMRREAQRQAANAGVGRGRSPQGEPRSHHWTVSPSEKAAEALSRVAIGRSLSPRQRERVGTALHFAFGAVAGAAYGALSATRAKPLVQAGNGTLYGAAVWLVGDEIMLPLTGFADLPQRTPLRRHAYVFAAHLAYGLGLHAATQAVARPHSGQRAGVARRS